MANKHRRKILSEVSQHYEMWTQDNEKRMTRKNGWNDITDAYWGKLPDDWPYATRIVDPRIRTSIIEKNGRLLNNKLRGRLVPREGGDTISSQINNALLDYQWETANFGGSMHQKLSISDQDARLYASKFAYVYWRYEVDEDGVCIFEGNEMLPLDIRDCGIDTTASHIRDAKWFQLRQWEHLEDLEAQLDANGKSLFKNLDILKERIETKLKAKSSTRRNEWTSRIKQLKGLEDRTGEDRAYPVVMIVREFRRDRWVTFVPDHNVIIQDIPNPYDHKKIPIAQLRYYPLQDDPHGESEVEPVLPIWIAIQATICGYMDESILKMRPPLKVIENAARVETIQYGPEAQWLVDNQDAIMEMKSSGDSLQYFQTSYQTLVSAFNVAMGDLSAQNSSGLDPFSNEAKTATEVKQAVMQQNMRDQKNQNDLAEFIKDIMLMWLSNNRQFLFSDPEKVEHIIRIVGKDQYSFYKRAGLDDLEIPRENMQLVQDIIEMNPNMSDIEIEQIVETASMPKYPVVLNPKEKNPSKIKMKPKMTVTEDGEYAEISIVPQDLEGTYDYIPDVKSMAAGAGEELMKARQGAIELFTTNPNVIQLLAQDGYRPNIKELIQSSFEEVGLTDSDRYFTRLEPQLDAYGQQNQAQAGAGQMGGALPPQPDGGVPAVPQANPAAGFQQQMA